MSRFWDDVVFTAWDYSDPKTGRFSDDRFWEEKVSWAESRDRTPDLSHCIRIDGWHYIAVPGIWPPEAFMGHGGRRMRWRVRTGTVYESNDVWNQGEIPEGFRDRLPDNAEWVPGWWCGGCQEYHEGTQCPVWVSKLKDLKDRNG